MATSLSASKGQYASLSSKLQSLFFTAVSKALGIFWLSVYTVRALPWIIRAPTQALGLANSDRSTVLKKVYEDTEDYTHHYADLGGSRRIHYVQAGKADGPLVLFLHGFPEFWYTMYSWNKQLVDLKSTGCRLVAMDLRGYGGSHKPAKLENYKLSCLMGDINDLIVYLGYQDCVLVAHDWGGVIAWGFAHYHAERVRKLVILNAPHVTNLQHNIREPVTNMCRMSWSKLLANPRQLVIDPLFRSVMQYASSSFYIHVINLRWGIAETFLSSNDLNWVGTFAKHGLTPEGVEMMKAVLGNRTGSPEDKRILWSMLALYRAGVFSDTEPLKITMPTTVIWGEKDTALRRDINLNNLDKWVSHLDVHMLDAGHFVHQEKPQEVNAILRKVLSRK
ncbi:Epoxide hydrolase 4 [Sorochytrium milnesiophthora]